MLNILDKYEITLILALSFLDECLVLEVATNSIKRLISIASVHHIPKKKLRILHIGMTFYSNKVDPSLRSC